VQVVDLDEMQHLQLRKRPRRSRLNGLQKPRNKDFNFWNGSTADKSGKEMPDNPR
jgi:hypothetical protein